MLILISPSKTIDFKGKALTDNYSQPVFVKESEILVNELKKKSARQLANMMKVNPKISQLNFERFQEWSLPFDNFNAQEVIFMFKGEVYNGLKAESLSKDDLVHAQNVLRILSGLYGILKPFDLIKPYRLEMGVKWRTRKWKSLYHFWGSKISEYVENEITNSDTRILVNLASKEYFDAIDLKSIKCRVITPTFKDFHNGTYKFMTVYGKKARGLMARFIIQKQIAEPEEMKLFDEEGYYYNENLSNGDNWVFTRG